VTEGGGGESSFSSNAVSWSARVLARLVGDDLSYGASDGEFHPPFLRTARLPVNLTPARRGEMELARSAR